VTAIFELEHDFWLVANAEGIPMVATRNDPIEDILTALAPLQNILSFVSPWQRSRWIAACSALEITG